MKTTEAVNSYFLDKDFTESTLESYRPVLERLAGTIEELPGTADDVRRLLKQAGTVWVRDLWWRVLSSFYGWCHSQYGITDIMELVSRPHPPEVEPRTLEPEELARVLAAALEPKAKAICALALDCGVRASEFGRIHIQDITREAILLHGKGNRHLWVPLTPETYRLLMELVRDLPDRSPNALVFPDRRGGPTCRDVIYKIVRRCMDRAGVKGPKRGPHCLRHSLGTEYIANGGDAFSLQKIMRHKRISTTQKYVNLSLRRIIEFHRKYSPLKSALSGSQGILFKEEVLAEAEAIIRRI